MTPDISEFSYGYALTDELIHWHGTTLTAAPVFPSLYKEGQAGGGYDVMLKRPGIPLFLQFKLSHCMVRNTAQEVKDGLLNTPFYRMYLRPSRHSDQHELLLDLERTGNVVYYTAPAFHTPEEFNDAYLNHQVRNRSLWIQPSVIGPQPDDESHHVAFQIPGTHHFCSKPRLLETKGNFEDFSNLVNAFYRQKAKIALNKQNLFDLAGKLAIIAAKRRDISCEAKHTSQSELEKRHPLDQIAFYAQVFLDCQFLIVHQKEADGQPDAAR